MTRLVSERAAAGATANDTSVRTPSVAANRVDLERRMTPTSGWSFMAGVGKVHRGRRGRVASARGCGTGAGRRAAAGWGRPQMRASPPGGLHTLSIADFEDGTQIEAAQGESQPIQ